MLAATILDRDAIRDIFGILENKSWAKDRQEELMNLWDLCTDAQERSLLKELIYDFFVFDRNEERSACDAIDAHFKSLNLDPKKTYVVSVADVGKGDGSSVGIQLLRQRVKPIPEWEDRYISHIPHVVELMENGDSIVLFDDFIGSGNKIIKKYGWLSKLIEEKRNDIKLNEVSIYVVSFSAMKFGIKHINDNIKVNVFSHYQFDKAISEKNSCIKSAEKIKTMTNIEGKLAENYNKRKLSNYSLGYNKSESLYYWVNSSCPNNVFPVFWWPMLKEDRRHDTLFNRSK